MVFYSQQMLHRRLDLESIRPVTVPVTATAASHHFDVLDIDGDGSRNSAYADGDNIGDVSSAPWVNQGTGTNATQGTPSAEMFYRKNGVKQLVASLAGDGLDHFDLASSETELQYVHGEADFEMVVVFRYDNNSATGGPGIADVGTSLAMIAGNSINTGKTGFGLFVNSADRTLNFWINNNVRVETNFWVTGDAVSPFDWNIARIRGVGTGIYISINNGAESSDLTLTGTLENAAATNKVSLLQNGSSSSTATTAHTDGALAFFWCANDALTADQWTDFYAELVRAYGTMPVTPETRIACIGDSLTLSDWDSAGRGADSFPQVLENLYDGNSVAVANYGVGGNLVTDGDIDGRLDNVLADDCEYVVILAGINDIGAGVSATDVWNTATDGLKAIIDRILSDGKKVLCCTLSPAAAYASLSAAEQEELLQLNIAIRSYAPDNYDYCDLYANMGGGGGGAPTELLAAYDAGDGLHWSQAGNDQAAALVKAALDSFRTTSASALLTDLVSYWKLDEASTGPWYDAHGANKLSIASGVGPSPVAGILGNCGDFAAATKPPAISDNVSVGLDGTNWTVSLWAKHSDQASTHWLVSKYDTSGDKEMWIYIINTLWAARASNNGTSQDATCSVAQSGDGEWHHVVVRYNGTNLLLDVDDGDVGSSSDSHAGTYAGTSDFTLGGEMQLQLHKEELDDVALWKRSLSDAEVTALYNSGAGVAHPFTGV